MKYVSVPLSAAAMKRLDYNEAPASELREFIIPDAPFMALWGENGFFEKINSALGTWIADYEDEAITDPAKLFRLLTITEEFRVGNDTIEKIHTLVLLAIDRKTGVFFYF